MINIKYVVLVGLVQFISITQVSAKSEYNQAFAEQNVWNHLGCPSFQEAVWDELKFEFLKMKNSEALTAAEVEKITQKVYHRLHDTAAFLYTDQFEQNGRDAILIHIKRIYSVVNNFVINENKKFSVDPVHEIAKLEFSKIKIIESEFLKIEQISLHHGFRCKIFSTDEIKQDSGARAKQDSYSQTNSSVFGARAAMATAYQSCDSVVAHNPLRAEDPDIDGIRTFCCHPDGHGQKRTISNLSKLLSTHHYLKGREFSAQGVENLLDSSHFKASESTGSQCLTAHQFPLIYDYGGRPLIDQTNRNAPFDFFRDAGTGTKVLGVDCSAFVFLAFARAGLKFVAKRTLNPVDLYAFDSNDYLTPESSGMTCMRPVLLTKDSSLQAGDVIAKPGHVFIVDSVGTDPLGIKRAKSLSDCNHLRYQDFDFTIIQSSSIKNGIGINRMRGADYIQSATEFQAGLIAYAKQACRSRILNQSIRLRRSDVMITRHLESSECREAPLHFQHESCIQNCIGQLY